MPKGSTIDEDNFLRLLSWLGGDDEQAGESYELLRQKLIKIFASRGCNNAEELADETFDRVAAKIGTIVETYEGDPRLYFFGVAKNVFHEQVRKPVMNELPVNLSQSERRTDELELHDRCLSGCLSRLDKTEKKFILLYYKGEKAVKIENRQDMMEKMNLTPQALRVKAFRIRARLQKCVFSCLNSELA